MIKFDKDEFLKPQIYSTNDEYESRCNVTKEIVDDIKQLQQENQELKKQLEKLKEEKQEWINLLDMFKNQQKEFINYLENMLDDENDIFSVVRVKDILSKYKEIIGVSDENNT